MNADIVNTISDYIKLTHKGNNFFGLCPFHSEKTPSFSVNESKQIFKCFGCGAGGGVFNFIMDIEKVDFPEAIKILADKNGIEIEYEKGSIKKSKNLTNEILEIHNIANKIYINNIAPNSNIKNYLINRDLRPNIISDFEIGLSIDSYTQILKILQKEKFSSNAMKSSGLFVETKKGYIDRFRKRIIFPIHNNLGKVVAFAGRSLDPNDNAKYMNSPETPIYNKSKLLYGLWKTKKNIIDKDCALIVEGYMDFLKMYQSGFDNIVAVSGTAFTDGHAIQIKRLCNKAILLYDGDEAGKKAALRTGYLCLKYNLEPFVVEIPENSDPDDWISEKGVTEVKNSINAPIELINFHFKCESKYMNSDIQKTKFINDCLVGLNNIDDPIYKELQIKKLADITKVSEHSIFSKLNNIKKTNITYSTKNLSDKENSTQKSPHIELENDLIRLCFSKKYNIRLLIYNHFDSKWLNNKINLEIFDRVYIHLHSEYGINESLIMDNIDDKKIRSHLATLLFDNNNIENESDIVKECINRLKKNYIKNKIEVLRINLKNINTESDKLNETIINISELEKEMNEKI